MDSFQVYKDMKARTNGEIYIGVVGPVRTGKSTFIRRFAELLILPNLKEEHVKQRTQDELPQAASGTTIMTTEPKFVPKEAADVKLSDDIEVKIRLADCVGFMVDGANGHTENGQERQVKTPWYDYEIPFTKAAEIGTQKVIHDHATIGFVVTTDGSVTDLPRENYVAAEERTVKELRQIGKPFLILLNCQKPYSKETERLRSALEEKYAAPVYPVNCEQLKEDDIYEMGRNVVTRSQNQKRSDRECEENYGSDVGSAKCLRKRLEDRKSIHRPDPVGSGRDGHRQGYIADFFLPEVLL